MGQAKANRDKRRLLRQFAAIERLAPATRGPLRPLLDPRWVLIRVPVAILLIIGGLLSFLPFLGVWMLPLGMLLLAVDIPALRPVTNVLMIRGRRWISSRLRRFRHR
ncbi:hypothetical protein ruthe_00786 [Rubellimicrobium thermophilum DSM 16684]|uniref:Transmembrane protein (PGPGW) n=1 Tax=Rubellimicrobium thermophilum DSM 16684 TaxID=1123069 RepID=S9R5E8_9RHOB|nr:hypothetical protein [Rubellimicrobium thermophilum]EPX87117.1 hypothetical protein ruthe_00786 [Rubellimicrobium thermophilum DSM 16684]